MSSNLSDKLVPYVQGSLEGDEGSVLSVKGEEGCGAAITSVMHLLLLSRLWHLDCEGVGLLCLLHLGLGGVISVLVMSGGGYYTLTLNISCLVCLANITLFLVIVSLHIFSNAYLA